MTTLDRPLAWHWAIALIVMQSILIAAAWYVEPNRPMVWSTLLVFVAATALVLVVAPRLRSTPAARQRAEASVSSGIVVAGLIVVVALVATLARAAGALPDSTLAERAMMLILGAFFVVTGNALPKTLAPLPSAPGDAARCQAARRGVGWTWVLTGIVFTAVWAIAPIALATPISVPLLVAGMVVAGTQLMRFHRARHGEV